MRAPFAITRVNALAGLLLLLLCTTLPTLADDKALIDTTTARALTWMHASVPVLTAAAGGAAAIGADAPLIGMIFSGDSLASDLHLDGTRVTRIVR